jgi:hypothetical protein
MIEAFTKAWFANLHTMREKFTAKHPDNYKEVVRAVVQMLAEGSTDYDKPDPERIYEIDDGNYQGTHVYVIGEQGYQPNKYWYVKVSYGSCSGCDTLKNIKSYRDGQPDADQVGKYMTLALHIVQGLREMGDSEA